MGWIDKILMRKMSRVLRCVTGGMFVVLLALSYVEVDSAYSDVWDGSMNILFNFWLMVLVVSLGVAIVAARCERKWGWLSRIGFYGLFFGGVCALVLSHSLYCETLKRDSGTVEVLDAVGISMLACWFVWLVVVMLMKLKPNNSSHNNGFDKTDGTRKARDD